jgi:hypothetical protein
MRRFHSDILDFHDRDACSASDFAVRSFRDVGDGDYVCARMAYRVQLIPQALWASLQAIEKYLKCILLLNRIAAPDVGHNLSRALHKIEGGKFKLRLSKDTREFIRYLDTFGRFRYFETPYHAYGLELVSLDCAAWEIRRYCTVLDYRRQSDDKPMLDVELKRIERAEHSPPQGFYFHLLAT